LKLNKKIKKEFSTEGNYINVKISDIYYIVGLGYSYTEYKNTNQLFLFNTDDKSYTRIVYKRIISKDDEDDNINLKDYESGSEFFIQRPATCVYKNKLYLFGGYENKNKQLKDLYEFDISKITNFNKNDEKDITLE